MDTPSKFDKLFAGVSRLQEEVRQKAKQKKCSERPASEVDEDDYDAGLIDGEISFAREVFDKLEAITFPIESGIE